LTLADLAGPPGRGDLISAVVCGFTYDLDWLLQHFSPTANLTLVLNNHDPHRPRRVRSHPNATVLYPRAEGTWGGVMHVKLLVLFYSTYCRIVILTGNLNPVNWTTCDNASWPGSAERVSVCRAQADLPPILVPSQALYVHDFPVRPSTTNSTVSTSTAHTHFTGPIVDLLAAMGVAADTLDPFGRYDFSSSAGVRTVATQQGKFVGWQEMERGGGMVGLAKAVKELGVTGKGRWTVEASGSAVGQMPPNWLGAMYAVSDASTSLKRGRNHFDN